MIKSFDNDVLIMELQHEINASINAWSHDTKVGVVILIINHYSSDCIKSKTNAKIWMKFTAAGKTCLHKTYSTNLMFLFSVLVSNLREQFKTSTKQQGLPDNGRVKMCYHIATKSLRVSWQIPIDKMHNLKLFCVQVCKNTSFCICMNFKHHHDCFINKKNVNFM